MARARDRSDEVLVGALLAFGPLLALLGGAYLLERWRRREAVFRPGQAPPTIEPGGTP